MKQLLCALAALILWQAAAFAQSDTVAPGDAELTVRIENVGGVPYTQEMVLVTIEGTYRRHITREKLEQPDLDGFNWMQLGNDHWYEETERGRPVKKFRRRMALFPERAGALEIGAFTHHLTLTDSGDDWFAHDILSAPVTLEVAAAPPVPEDGWWFPVRRLQIADDWSNAPDQLAPGEGVLRIIRIEATGVGPDMIPPMPELTSPSAMIFPHPEKRLVELSPIGPVSVAFWRWTIRPTNDVSAIVEPLEIDFFDTNTREAHRVEITAQRVAYETATRVNASDAAPPPPREAAALPPALLLAMAALGLIAGLVALMAGRRVDARHALARIGWLDPLRRALFRAERDGDAAGLRRAATALMRRDGGSAARADLLAALDRVVFAGHDGAALPERFAARFASGRSETIG